MGDSSSFDVVVLGAGPAGEVGAIRAAQLGLRVAVVEKSPHLGGTCLNVGCIPTKALIAAAHTFQQLKSSKDLGFDCGEVSCNWHKVMDHKDDIVEQQRRGLRFLMKKNKIAVIKGTGALADRTTLTVTGEDEQQGARKQEAREQERARKQEAREQERARKRALQKVSEASEARKQPQARQSQIKFKHLLIAAGSQVTEFPPFVSNSTNIMNSDTVLSIDHIPSSLAIIGGGVVGMEFACMFAEFGSKVSVYETAETILRGSDAEVVQTLQRSCKKRGINIFTSTKIEALDDRGKDGVQVKTANKTEMVAKVLLSIGRTPDSAALQLQNIGVELDAKGFVPVATDTYRVRGHEHIYAVGDVIATQALAHTASAEALRAVEHMAGNSPPPIDYRSSPLAIYTAPEIAAIGSSEEELRAGGVEFKTAKFPFAPLAKAKIEGHTEGFIKILFDPRYHELLGVHIINAKATELIAEFVLGKNLETTLDEIAHTIHPHPTISETIMEAAHAGVHGQALHL